MKVCLDESGIHDGAKVCAIAGYFGTMIRGANLKENGLLYSKSSECPSTTLGASGLAILRVSASGFILTGTMSRQDRSNFDDFP